MIVPKVGEVTTVTPVGSDSTSVTYSFIFDLPSVEDVTIDPSLTFISKGKASGASLTGVIFICIETMFPNTKPSKDLY